MPEGLAQAVAGTELHCLVARLGEGVRGRNPADTGSRLVQQVPPFAAAGLGEEQACAWHAGRVVLHELHVAKRHAVLISERHAIAGDDTAVGVLAEHAARAAGGEDHRLGR